MFVYITSNSKVACSVLNVEPMLQTDTGNSKVKIYLNKNKTKADRAAKTHKRMEEWMEEQTCQAGKHNARTNEKHRC